MDTMSRDSLTTSSRGPPRRLRCATGSADPAGNTIVPTQRHLFTRLLAYVLWGVNPSRS